MTVSGLSSIFCKTRVLGCRTCQHATVGTRNYIAAGCIDDTLKRTFGGPELEDLAADRFDHERQLSLDKRTPRARRQHNRISCDLPFVGIDAGDAFIFGDDAVHGRMLLYLNAVET